MSRIDDVGSRQEKVKKEPKYGTTSYTLLGGMREGSTREEKAKKRKSQKRYKTVQKKVRRNCKQSALWILQR